MDFIKDLKGKSWIDWIKIIIAIDISSVGIGLIIGIDFHVFANLLGFISRIFFGVLYVFVAVLMLKRVFPTVLHVDGNDDLEKGDSNTNSDILRWTVFIKKMIKKIIKKIISISEIVMDKIDEKLDKIELFFKKRKAEIKSEIKEVTRNNYMGSREIRNKFLMFFEKRGHAVITSASLITTDVAGETNLTLFNTAGMQPLIQYLMGKKHEKGTRLVSSQRCVRTVDIEEVGDNTHASFFEMLGNWSLGDYFKDDSIRWSWEFLTDEKEGLGLDPRRIFVTVFSGGKIDGKDVEKDEASIEIWKDILEEAGLNYEKRIFYKLNDNWWSAGDNSPCGATTEIFYDISGEFLNGLNQDEFEKFEDDQKIVEIWNNVFMEFIKENGIVVGDLAKKNVDTGAGLERLTAVLQRVPSIYDTDLFFPIMDILKKESKSFSEYEARIIADHIKTTIFMVFDGVNVSNSGRGYVLRKMIRRAVNNMQVIGFNITNTQLIIDTVVLMYEGIYNLSTKVELIKRVLSDEFNKYIKTLEVGKKELTKLSRMENFELSGEIIANLEQTYGLPFDITSRIAKNMGIKILKSSIKDYEKLKNEHKEKSRIAGEVKFKGGLASDSLKVTALHTVTHLMLAGLRKYLGDSIYQKGSNITENRTRFDFSFNEKVSRDLLNKVEEYVNSIIQSGAIVSMKKMKKEDAKKLDVVGSFWEKYPDEVNVYVIKDKDNGVVYSKELCGGPHVSSMDDISKFGVFKIKKEESSSAGIRRIKAVLE